MNDKKITFQIERECYAATLMLEAIKEPLQEEMKKLDHIQLFQIISLIDQMKNGVISNIVALESNFDLKVTHPDAYKIIYDNLDAKDKRNSFDTLSQLRNIFELIYEDYDVVKDIRDLTELYFEDDPIGYTTEYASSLFKLTIVLGNVCNAYTASKLFVEEKDFKGKDAEYIKEFKTPIRKKFKLSIFEDEDEGDVHYVPKVEKLLNETGHFEIMILILHAILMKYFEEMQEMISEELKTRKIKNGTILENFNKRGICDYRAIMIEKNNISRDITSQYNKE